MFYLNEMGMICALGTTPTDIVNKLKTGTTGIQNTLGKVVHTLPDIHHLPIPLQSRNNQLALAALDSIRPAIDTAISEFGAHRIGIIIGTSTSGIAEAESAIKHQQHTGSLSKHFHYQQQHLGSPAHLLQTVLGIQGPSYVHSSACVSAAKAMASAARLIRLGLCDAVITGGVDSLCEFTVAGFSALQAVSNTLCNPFSKNRKGINIGEGAALFLLSRKPSTIRLCSVGESSDGHHISAPDPSGKGAILAIEQALNKAQLSQQQIDYVNLHGTGTEQNDAMEAKVIAHFFKDKIPVSSTKPFTGHALGASSAIEAGLCILAMQHAFIPPHLWDGVQDDKLPILQMAQIGINQPLRRVLSTSFAFGGSNAAMLLQHD